MILHNPTMDVASSSSSAPPSITTLQQPWLDCARSYGLSEKFVGEYLRNNNIQTNQVYVSSKWGYSKLHLQEKKDREWKNNKNESYQSSNLRMLIH